MRINSDWIEINPEYTRDIYFKSGHVIVIHNVTHYKPSPGGLMLKCDEGAVYCDQDDISCIVSNYDEREYR